MKAQLKLSRKEIVLHLPDGSYYADYAEHGIYRIRFLPSSGSPGHWVVNPGVSARFAIANHHLGQWWTRTQARRYLRYLYTLAVLFGPDESSQD